MIGREVWGPEWRRMPWDYLYFGTEARLGPDAPIPADWWPACLAILDVAYTDEDPRRYSWGTCPEHPPLWTPMPRHQ